MNALAVPTSTALMTADEFYEFTNRSENEGRRFELVRGEVIEMPVPTKIHGVVAANIGRVLGNFTVNRGFGYVTTNDSGTLLERDPDTVRGPDVAIFEDASSFAELHPKYGEVPPVLAVEVVHSDVKAGKLAKKIDDYLDNGVKVVWVVDYESRTIRIHPCDRRAFTLTEEQELEGGEMLPGFQCKVAAFFFVPGPPPAKAS